MTTRFLAIVATAIYFACAAVQASAQGLSGVAVVDIQRVMRDSAAAKSIQGQIEKMRGSYQQEITKQENELRNAEQELNRQRTLVSPEAFNERRRQFDERDGPAARKVAIVNEAFAQRFFPQGDVLGKRIGFGCEEAEGTCRTIVGVVGNIRQESLTDEVAAELFLPSAQMPMNGITLFVRTAVDPVALTASIRNAVLTIDKDQPIYDVKTLAQRVSEATAVSQSLTILFATFALLALVLGAIGIYGIVSYAVTQRTQEIGIRMALGARAGDILGLILKHGVVLVLSGVVIGVAGALALTRFLASLLFEVTPTDTVTFVIVSVIFFVIAMLASFIPARRATKVNPLVALRYE